MKKLFKKIVVFIMIGILCFPFLNVDRVKANVGKKMTKEEIIKLTEPHIVTSWRFFSIYDELSLIQKIGFQNVESLKVFLKQQNNEIAIENSRDAVGDTQIRAFRSIGATVERPFWGTRIKTHNRRQSLAARELADYFSGNANKESIISALISIGFPTVGPFLGAWSIVTAFDGATWGMVVKGIGDRMLYYNQDTVTIDINGWYINVVVY